MSFLLPFPILFPARVLRAALEPCPGTGGPVLFGGSDRDPFLSLQTEDGQATALQAAVSVGTVASPGTWTELVWVTRLPEERDSRG